MKKLIFIALSITLLTTAFTSCRDQKSEKETLIEEMKADGADIKIKDNGDKIKMETEDKEVKIKTDDEGNTKIKVDNDN